MKRAFLIMFLGLFVFVSTSSFAQPLDDIPRISKDALKAKLDSPSLILLDVRTERDWEKSDEKIKGATRVDPANVKAWMDGLPKNKEIVLYCS